MTKKTKKIIVNALTLSRLLGALFLPYFFIRVNVPALLILLAILFLTDFFDGKLSRKWEVQTTGGSLLDPLGDKMLAISCIFSLIERHNGLFLLVFLELMICTLNIYRTLHGEKVKSSFIGKFKTWVLSITLIMGAINLFNPDLFDMVANFIGINGLSLTVDDEVIKSLIMLTAGVELVTIVTYMKESFDNKTNRSAALDGMKPIKEVLKRLFDESHYIEDKGKPLVDIIRK